MNKRIKKDRSSQLGYLQVKRQKWSNFSCTSFPQKGMLKAFRNGKKESFSKIEPT